MKRATVTTKILSLSILTLMLILNFSCSTETSTQNISPPVKPPGVPEKAFWCGGVDGGVFIFINRNENDPPDTYYSEIYYDTSGELWYKGTVSIEPSGGPHFDYTNKDLYTGWDGDTLYLKDGRILKAVTPGAS